MPDAEGKPSDKTRAEQVEENGGFIALPEQTAPYLLDYLQRLGVYAHGAAGPVPLSSLEIRAWSEGSGIALKPWEFEALRAASRSYLVCLHGTDDTPPYGDPDDLADPDVVDARLEALFDRLARPIKKRDSP
ncbi:MULTISPECIES: hypothetical protein [unclassified Acidovorax]|uniref:hypothetical protein n=1 Tax=unclassified Acidovorax TaxID=2684926 RepID=UPI001C445C0A|nr:MULTISPECIES: hypothetical protein [unclassified Acidovorax]MBV7427275.1 hypothetical protein [Acidovorax sp. sif0732]MBV7448399.1 hypothetical protein [Acidovorax sp. sif0715]